MMSREDYLEQLCEMAEKLGGNYHIRTAVFKIMNILRGVS